MNQLNSKTNITYRWWKYDKEEIPAEHVEISIKGSVEDVMKIINLEMVKTPSKEEAKTEDTVGGKEEEKGE